MEGQRKTVTGYGSVKMHLPFILYTDYCKREIRRLFQLRSKFVLKNDMEHHMGNLSYGEPNLNTGRLYKSSEVHGNSIMELSLVFLLIKFSSRRLWF